jgi:parallel beta-helix repeat protein
LGERKTLGRVISRTLLILFLIGILTCTFNIPGLTGLNAQASNWHDYSRQELGNDSETNSGKSNDLNQSKTSGLASFEWSEGEYARLIIGIDASKSQEQDLRRLVTSRGGDISDMISTRENVKALTAEVPSQRALSFAEELRANKSVKYVEPDSKIRAFYVPNDPYWAQQWGPKKIEADLAWNTTVGSSDILVAIVDTGINYNHPDLAASYVPLGYDWVTPDSNPMDDHGHGTHCAGIVAAKINNGVGMAGLAQVRIMTEKVLNSAGWGYDSWVAEGIYHATDAGARIISMSLGGSEDSSAIHDAIKYAYNHGVLLVAAAGNEGNDLENYPAAYEGVVAVTATDPSDYLAWFSSYGSWVELSAPGVGIYSTVLGNSYASWSGTSMACPHVSGVAALVWSQCTNLTNTAIRYILKQSADDLGDSGFDDYFGYGRVNARKAVISVQEHDISITDWQYPHRIDPGQPGMFNATISNYGCNDETHVSVHCFANTTFSDVKWIDTLKIGASTLASFSWNTTIVGNYKFTCYVVPVSGENKTENNIVSSIVQVRLPSILRVPNDYPTIKQALNTATSGDAVLVSEGRYTEGRISFPEDGVALVADGHVILDGQNQRYVLDINADHIVVEGFEIRNSSSYVVNMRGYCNTLTRNYVYTSNNHGIRLYKSHNCTISWNNVTTPVDWFPYRVYTSCLLLERSSECTIDSNLLIGGALFLQLSQNNLLSSNDVTNGNYGLVLEVSFNNTLRNNVMMNNSRNFCILKNDFEDYPMLKSPSEAVNDIDTSNTVNGKPIYYWIGVSDRAVPSDAGCVVLIHCVNINIEGLDIRNNLDGILLLDTNNTLISRNNLVANTGYLWEFECGGVTALFDSSNNIIIQNNLTSDEAGVWVHGGYNYTVKQNNVINCREGLFLETINSVVSLNNLTDNWDTAYFYGSNHTVILNNMIGTQNLGVRFMGANHVFEANNLLSGNTGLELDYTTNSTVVSNNVTDTRGWPIWLFAASGNKIFHNNIINSGWPVKIQALSADIWDDGYPNGGNYWSNYTGADDKSGPNQDQPGSDGIADTPYTMDVSNQDRYPLMKPLELVINIAVSNVKSKTVVGQGCNFSVEVTIENQWYFAENCNVTVYINATVMDTKSVTLPAKCPTTVTFALNTASFAKGNYTISAHASPVTHETKTIDNTLTGNWVLVTISGDTTGDGTVNFLDATLLGAAFSSKPGNSEWNANADINNDYAVNYLDAIVLGANFGNTDP